VISVDSGFWDRSNDGRRIFALGRGLETVEVSVTLDGAALETRGKPCIPRSVSLGSRSQAPRQRQRESGFGWTRANESRILPSAAFGGEFRVVFDQLGEEFTSCLTSPSCWLPSSGGWSSCRQEGVGAGVYRRRREPMNRGGKRSMRESLLMTLGSALIFIKSVAT